MDFGIVGNTAMAVISGMHKLFGLEGMVGVLIGFLLYALYHTVKSQFFKIIIIIMFVLVIWGVAFYLSNGQDVNIPAFENAVTDLVENSSSISTLNGTVNSTT